MNKPFLPLADEEEYNQYRSNYDVPVMTGGSGISKQKMNTTFLINGGNLKFFDDEFVIDSSKFKINNAFLQKKYSGKATLEDYYNDFLRRNNVRN
jgi:hypothetical protein